MPTEKRIAPGLIKTTYKATILSGDNKYLTYPMTVLVEMGEVSVTGEFSWATIRQISSGDGGSTPCPQHVRNPVFRDIRELEDFEFADRPYVKPFPCF